MAALMDVENGTWEYACLVAKGGELAQLMAQLNDLTADGWELVTVVVQDAGLAGTMIGAPIRRLIDPLPAPTGDAAEGWYEDPSGRFDKRFWTGRAWTFHVARQADESQHRDPPTRRTPSTNVVQ